LPISPLIRMQRFRRLDHMPLSATSLGDRGDDFFDTDNGYADVAARRLRRSGSQEIREVGMSSHTSQRPTNPALARLGAFVGTWQIEASVGGQTVGGTAHTTFAWLEDGAFLVQHADAEPDQSLPEDWAANSPFPVTTITGLDDATGTYTQLFADARGVFRVYHMTLQDGVWRIWREAPGFHQRFEAVFDDDGATITGRWEMSQDGTHWSPDFDVTYTKTD
jgi:hypothetical protein